MPELTDFPPLLFLTLSFLEDIKLNSFVYSSFSILLNVWTTEDFNSTSKSNDLERKVTSFTLFNYHYFILNVIRFVTPGTQNWNSTEKEIAK